MSRSVVEFARNDIKYKLVVDAERDEYQRAVARDGGWSPHFDILRKLARRNLSVVDVGANIGAFSIPMAIEGFKVLSYEADQTNVEFLRTAAEINSARSLRICQRAAWSKDVYLNFHPAGAWSQVRSDGEVRVKAVRIDGDLPWFTRIGVIKLDVEGNESHVLAGLSKVLKRDLPDIGFECNPYAMGLVGTNLAGLFDQLDLFGYKLYRMVPELGVLAPRKSVQETTVTDYLATVRSESELELLLGLSIRPLTATESALQIEVDSDSSDHHKMFAAASMELRPELPLSQSFTSAIPQWQEKFGDDLAYLGIRKALGL